MPSSATMWANKSPVNRERLRAKWREREARYRTRRNAARKDRYQRQKLNDPEGLRAVHRKKTKDRPDIYSAISWRKLERLRAETFIHYGEGAAACVSCGVGDLDVLMLDHIGNNGNVERAAGVGTGHKLYRMLRGKGWPSGYQTLCANCNQKKAMRHRREMAVARVRTAMHSPTLFSVIGS